MNVLLYGPRGTVTADLARAIADMFGLEQVLGDQAALFQVTEAAPALLVREATEAPARNLAQAYGFRTLIHADDARRLLAHAYGAPPVGGLEVVETACTGLLKGNDDLSPEEQRAIAAAEANRRG